MSIPVDHNWQPSERLLRLIDRAPRDQIEMIKSKMPDPPLNLVIEDRLYGKVKARTFNGLRRGILYEREFIGMTWGDLIRETEKPFILSKFRSIRDFGIGSFNDLKKALET